MWMHPVHVFLSFGEGSFRCKGWNSIFAQDMVAVHPRCWNKCCCCSVVPQEEEFQPCPSTDRWESPSRASFLCQVILSNSSNSLHITQGCLHGPCAASSRVAQAGSTRESECHSILWEINPFPQQRKWLKSSGAAEILPACPDPWSSITSPSLHCSDSAQIGTTHTSEPLQLHPQSTIWFISPGYVAKKCQVKGNSEFIYFFFLLNEGI